MFSALQKQLYTILQTTEINKASQHSYNTFIQTIRNFHATVYKYLEILTQLYTNSSYTHLHNFTQLYIFVQRLDKYFFRILQNSKQLYKTFTTVLHNFAHIYTNIHNHIYITTFYTLLTHLYNKIENVPNLAKVYTTH